MFMHSNKIDVIERVISEREPEIHRVLLYGAVIGEIKSESGGYRFYPKNTEGTLFPSELGDWFQTLYECKKSLAFPTY